MLHFPCRFLVSFFKPDASYSVAALHFKVRKDAPRQRRGGYFFLNSSGTFESYSGYSKMKFF